MPGFLFQPEVVVKKKYTYDEIHALVRSGASQVRCHDFKPDYILAVGGGGFIPARILRTFINVPILATSLSFYEGDSQTPSDTPKIIQSIDGECIHGKNVLIVDEIDDTRKTLKVLLDSLPPVANYGIFVVHNKQKEKVLTIADDIPYFVCETTQDVWIEYPWDMN
jgi:hypothetical protein